MSDSATATPRRRGKNFTSEELNLIRRGLATGLTTNQIAAFLNRGESAVRRKIQQMRRDGTIGQGVLDVYTVEVSE